MSSLAWRQRNSGSLWRAHLPERSILLKEETATPPGGEKSKRMSEFSNIAAAIAIMMPRSKRRRAIVS
jgi:hypothetical protein